MIRVSFLLIACHVFSIVMCQGDIGKEWNMEYGASTVGTLKPFSVVNLRYISPRFKWSYEEWNEEMEKDPEKYKKARFMFELLYAPPIQFLGLGMSVQYRFIRYKRLSVEAYGVLKFIFVAPPDYVINPHTSSRDAWYIDPGLICQLSFDLVAPFVDVCADGILTVGTEVNVHRLRKKLRRKFGTPYLREG